MSLFHHCRLQNVLLLLCFALSGTLVGLAAYQLTEPTPIQVTASTYEAAIGVSIAVGVLGLVVIWVPCVKHHHLHRLFKSTLCVNTLLTITAVGLWGELVSELQGACSDKLGLQCPDVLKLIDVMLALSICACILFIVLTCQQLCRFDQAHDHHHHHHFHAEESDYYEVADGRQALYQQQPIDPSTGYQVVGRQYP